MRTRTKPMASVWLFSRMCARVWSIGYLSFLICSRISFRRSRFCWNLVMLRNVLWNHRTPPQCAYSHLSCILAKVTRVLNRWKNRAFLVCSESNSWIFRIGRPIVGRLDIVKIISFGCKENHAILNSSHIPMLREVPVRHICTSDLEPIWF